MRRWMGNGLGCESRPFDMAEKTLMESLCELSGEKCPKTEPHHWGTERLNYPESWSNFMRALVQQEGKRGNGVVKLCPCFSVAVHPGLVLL